MSGGSDMPEVIESNTTRVCCSNCLWYDNHGHCIRHAPVVGDMGKAEWPRITNSDTKVCGEWEMRILDKRLQS